MSFATDLDVFFADFGSICKSGSITGKGNLLMPAEYLQGDVVISTDYTLLTKASLFGELNYGSSMTVDGTAYTVREARLLDDGLLVEFSLQKT